MGGTGFKQKEGYVGQLFNNNNKRNISTLGHWPTILMLLDSDVDKGGKKEYFNYPVQIFSEAVAIPTTQSQGRQIILGLATQPTHAKTAVHTAILFVQEHLDALTDLMGMPPYIDFNECIRLRPDPAHPGKAIPAADNAAVDIIMHVPPYYSAFFLAPSMVVAIVMMLWRQPCEALRTWSVVGGLHDDEPLHGYPKLDDRYISEADETGFKTLLVPTANVKQIEDQGLDLKGITVVGCDTMMDMLKVVIDFVVRGQLPVATIIPQE